MTKHTEIIGINAEDIVFAHYGWHPDSNFWNARSTFDEKPLQELREDIISNGLTQEITIRTYSPLLGDKKQVVCGERRLRIILDLLKDNTTCFDKTTRSWKPAREVYVPLTVKVEYECDDERAIKLSYGENGARDNVSDYDNMKYCYELSCLKRNGKNVYEQKDISRLLTRSITWVSQTLSFLSLPPRAKEMLQRGVLNRSTALYFLKIDDEFMHQYLDFVEDTIKQMHNEEQEKSQSVIDKLQEQIEANSAIEVIMKKKGQETTKVKRSKQQLQEQLKEAKEKKKNISVPKLTPNQMQEIASKLPRSRKGKSIVLSHKQIRKCRNDLRDSLEFHKNKQLAIHILNFCLGDAEEKHVLHILQKYTD